MLELRNIQVNIRRDNTCTSCSYQSGGIIPFDMRQTWKRQTYISTIHSIMRRKATTVAFISHVAMPEHCTVSLILWCPHRQRVRAICWGLELGRDASDDIGRSSKRGKRPLVEIFNCKRTVPLVPCSCRCRWCMSRRVGSTLPAFASADLGFGGSG